MSQSLSLFQSVINRGQKSRRPHVGVGVEAPHEDILRSLRRAKRHARITLVGSMANQIDKGFETVVSREPEKKLAELLAKGEVEGIVR